MSDDKKVSDLYRKLPREEPPRALDEAILAASRRRPMRWAGPLAAAAVLVLAVAVGLQVERGKPDAVVIKATPPPVPQSTPAPKPAVPAPSDRRTFAADPPKEAPAAAAEQIAGDGTREAARAESRADARGAPQVMMRAPASIHAPAARPAPQAMAVERWFLLARHGECADVSTLKRRVPELGEINDPQAFAALMRGQGYEVTAAPVEVPSGKAFEIKVPQKALALMFVTAELCSGNQAR